MIGWDDDSAEIARLIQESQRPAPSEPWPEEPGEPVLVILLREVAPAERAEQVAQRGAELMLAALLVGVGIGTVLGWLLGRMT